jgi:hypothetical protein
MELARTLKVFVQCDPSHPVFEGFRISKDFYTDFCGDLLQKILERLPGLVQVEFDAWPSVEKNGPLMSRLLAETRHAQKKVLWGPDRGWTDYDDDYKKRNNNDADAAFDGLRAHPPDAIEGLAILIARCTGGGCPQHILTYDLLYIYIAWRARID